MIFIYGISKNVRTVSQFSDRILVSSSLNISRFTERQSGECQADIDCLKMEGLVLHGAAHIFFENKLEELESHINAKFKKIEFKLKKEMEEIFHHQAQDIKKIKRDILEIKEELSEIKRSEENLQEKGITKISKLSKEVKTELNEIKKLKSDVNVLKKDVIGIRQSEEDISRLGMDKLSKISEEFKAEMKMIKSDVKTIKRDITSVKDSKKKADNSDTEDAEQQRDGSDTEKSKHSRKRNNSYREAKIPSTIPEKFNSSEDEGEDEGLVKKQVEKEKNCERETSSKVEAGAETSSGGPEFSQNFIKNFDDDHIRSEKKQQKYFNFSLIMFRKLVFSSHESSDYHQESSDYHESDAVSDDETYRSGHFERDFNVKRIFSKKFLYK